MKMKKRLIAMLMVMLMVLSMLPASALAAAGTAEPCAHTNVIYDEMDEPTCTEDGYGYWACNDCQEGGYYTIPALGHAWGSWQSIKEPSCTEGGKRMISCNRCGYSYSEKLPALGHDMGEWYTVTEPTENAPGMQQCGCSRCDYSETRYIGSDGIVHGLDVSLSIQDVSAPKNGSYYTAEDNKASIQYFLNNTGDYSIKNVSVYFFDMSEGPFASSYVMNPHTMMSNEVTYKLGPFTEDATKYIYCSASFEDEQGNYYTIVSNYLAYPLGVDGEEATDKSSSDLIMQLIMPELPECGFFTEGSQVHLNGIASAKLGNVYNADIGCGLNQYPVIANNTTVPYSVDIVIDYLDCVVGYRDVKVFGCYYAENGDFCTTYSNMIRIPCGFVGDENDRAFNLSLMEVSIPENYYEKTQQGLSPFYQEGETIWLQLLLTDSDNYLTGNNMEHVSAELFMNSPEFVPVEAINCGDYIFGDYTGYKVTAEDVKRGYVDTCGFANVVDNDFGVWQLTSNELMLPCGSESSALEAQLLVLSNPANGLYFVPGEQVWFALYLTNSGEVDVHKISITDALMGQVGYLDFLPFGAYNSVQFMYTVTDKDAENGSLVEICTAKGKEASADSNAVMVPCGEGILTGKSDIQVFKHLNPYCKPANGMRFIEGELLAYYIIVANCSDQPLYDIAVHDSRLPDYEAIVKALAPGETIVYGIIDYVNADDTASGWAMNFASAVWMDDGATYHITNSNVVAAPAGLNNSVLYSDGESTMCRTMLIGEADGVYQYEQSLCPEHQAVMEAVTQLFEGCDSLEAYYAAYHNMRQLWTDSLNELYEDWMAEVCGDYYVAAVKDRDAFFAMLEAYEKALPTRGIDDDMSVDVLLSEIVRSKCLELCYELHTAPEPSPASWLQEGIPAIEAYMGSSCMIDLSELQGSCFNFTDDYCEPHSALLESALLNVRSAKNENETRIAWSFARTIARTQLQKSYAKMAANADDASAALLREDSAKLIEYLTQREETLMLYRSDDYMALSEAYVRSLIYRIALNCMSQS